MFPKRLTQEM